ncbi:hypothetical protein D3C85_1446310 [compost metagenome]
MQARRPGPAKAAEAGGMHAITLCHFGHGLGIQGTVRMAHEQGWAEGFAGVGDLRNGQFIRGRQAGFPGQ